MAIQAPRSTNARRVVIELLKSNHIPQSLRSLHVCAQQRLPKLAFSTVFRIIRSLEEQSEVVRIDWRERGSHYEWASDHHHLICRGCGTVRDLSDAELNFRLSAVQRRTGYRITGHSIELEGLCPTCQQNPHRT